MAQEQGRPKGSIQAVPNGQRGTSFSAVVFHHPRQGEGYVLCVGDSHDSAWDYARRQVEQNETLDSYAQSASENLPVAGVVHELVDWFGNFNSTLALERLLLPHLFGVSDSDDAEHGLFGFEAAIAALIATHTIYQGENREAPKAPDFRDVEDLQKLLKRFHQATQDHVVTELLRDKSFDDDVRPAHRLAMKLLTAEIRGDDLKLSVFAAKMHDSLWGSQAFQAHWKALCGFSLQDLRAVDKAISGHMDRLGERIVAELRESQNGGGFPEDAAQLYDLAARALNSRGKIFYLAPEDVAASSGIPTEVVRSVLDFYTYKPSGRTLVAELASIVRGQNPNFGRLVFRVNEREYLVLPGGTSEVDFLRILGFKVKEHGQKKEQRLRDALHNAATEAAGDVLDRLSGGFDLKKLNFEYYSQNDDAADVVNLSRQSKTYRSGKKVEADALLVVDNVAICLEVKARGMRPNARTGGIAQLLGDLKAIVQGADAQAGRLSQLIQRNSGVWAADGHWIDLSKVREVHSLIVTTEDLGQVGIATHDMAQLGILVKGQYPWLVSLHDLHVVGELLAEPHEFGTYLRRRTDATTSANVSSEREFDLTFWFLRGGLDYVEDPEILHQRFPHSYSPKREERQLYEQQPFTIVSPFVASLNDLLEALEQGHSWQGERRGLPPVFDSVVQLMREERRPGWFQAGTSLYGMFPASLLADHAAVEDSLDRGQRTGKWWTTQFGTVDIHGHFTVSVRFVHEPTFDPDRFRATVLADKYRARADRVLGVALDEAGAVVDCLWIHEAFAEDPVMEALAPPVVTMPIGSHRTEIPRRTAKNAKTAPGPKQRVRKARKRRGKRGHS